MSGARNREREGFFSRAGKWLSSQKTQFDMQRLTARRNAAAASYMAYQDKAFAEIDAQPEKDADTYDKWVDRYAFRKNEQERLNAGKAPEYEAIGELNYGFSGKLKDLDLDTAEKYIKDPYQKGTGLGAFVGRLVTGRMSAEARENGAKTYERLVKDTMFAQAEEKDLAKLAEARPMARHGDALKGRSLQDVLKETKLDDEKWKDATIKENAKEVLAERAYVKAEILKGRDKMDARMQWQTELDTKKNKEFFAQFNDIEAATKDTTKKEISVDAITKTPEERAKAPEQKKKWEPVKVSEKPQIEKKDFTIGKRGM